MDIGDFKFNYSDISQLARKYSYSMASIGQIIELIMFSGARDNNINSINFDSETILNLTKTFLSFLKIPQKYFTVRVNLTKMDWVRGQGSQGKDSFETKVLLAKQIIRGLKDEFKESDMRVNNFIDNINGTKGDNLSNNGESKSLLRDKMLKILDNIKLDPIIPNVIYLPILGPNNIELHEKKITIDRFAAESVMIGADLYIPGFNKTTYVFSKGDLLSILGPGSIHVANGIAAINGRDLRKMVKGLGVKNIEPLYWVIPFRESRVFKEGYISDHNFSPLIACWALMSDYDRNLDRKILDLCSAPGHKTTAISEIGYYLSGGTFPQIISSDRSIRRMGPLYGDLERLGLRNIEIIRSKIQRLLNQHPELKNSFDVVILDPPCSALGLHPRLMIDDPWDNFRNLFLLQRSFLKLADAFIKSSGLLMYNTCTQTIMEDEAIVSYAINKLDYRLLSIPERLSKIFPERFQFHQDLFEVLQRLHNNSMNKAQQSGDPHEFLPNFKKELFRGISLNTKMIDALRSNNRAPIAEGRFHFENIDDIEKYLTLSPQEADKVVRTYSINPKTEGYFMAILEKK
ncbi:MAG: PUA domain-containing protein [Promethearchaeota archaeon]